MNYIQRELIRSAIRALSFQAVKGMPPGLALVLLGCFLVASCVIGNMR